MPSTVVPSARIAFIAMLFAMQLGSCSGGGVGSEDSVGGPFLALRIYHDPYGQVDWSQDLRLKVQLHDHIGSDESRIRAYDHAGYDAIVLDDYSGDPDKPYALQKRLWSPEAVLPASLLSSLASLKFFIPGAEEVGLPDHFISPFLTDYVERWRAWHSPQKQPWQYENGNELVEFISTRGGLAFVAHPWNLSFTVDQFPGLAGAEIYSAFSEAMRRRGSSEFVLVDRNDVLLDNWDRALAGNQSLIGIAVNDHFGPLPSSPTEPEVADSGKIVVLSKAASLLALKEAMGRRAVLAVRDMGRVKDRFPGVRRITVGPTSIVIDADGLIRWISRGAVVGTGPRLNYDSLPPGATYLRAEMESPDGSITFTQAFVIRPVGDADADGDVDSADRAICNLVRAGQEADPDRVAACS